MYLLALFGFKRDEWRPVGAFFQAVLVEVAGSVAGGALVIPVICSDLDEVVFFCICHKDCTEPSPAITVSKDALYNRRIMGAVGLLIQQPISFGLMLKPFVFVEELSMCGAGQRCRKGCGDEGAIQYSHVVRFWKSPAGASFPARLFFVPNYVPVTTRQQLT